MSSLFQCRWSAHGLVLTLAVALVGCSRPVPVTEPVRAVRTLTVSADTAGGTSEFAGEVRARVESRLGFRVAGKMVARQVELGQSVRAGQVLARLDMADLKLSQEAALAASRAAQSNYELAAAEFERYKSLRDQGFISALELERRAAALTAQRASRDQAQAQAAVQANQAGYAVLTATDAGVITGIDADVGAVLTAGAPVLRLALDGARDAVFAVPEDQRLALHSLIGRPGALQVRAWGAQAWQPATVREVAAAADPTTRTYQVRASLAGTVWQLGQTLTVRMEQPRVDGVVRLPLAAVMQHQGGSAVWLVDPVTMTVQPQPVVVATADGNSLVLGAGLMPGQVVVTAGVHALSPGQKVTYYGPPPVLEVPASAAAR